MFKPTLALQKTIRRLPLNTKQAKKDYYKGNNVGKMGTIDQFGRFKVDWNEVRTYMFPRKGLQGSPFITKEEETRYRDHQVQQHLIDLKASDEAKSEAIMQFERPTPEYNIVFPDEKKNLGDELLLKWRAEKMAAVEK